MIRQTRPPAGSQPVAVARVVLVFDRDARTTSTDLCLLSSSSWSFACLAFFFDSARKWRGTVASLFFLIPCPPSFKLSSSSEGRRTRERLRRADCARI